MSFILVAKPTDHKLLFQWVDEIDGPGQGGSLQFSDDKGRRHVYRWVNQVPLNGSHDADYVNLFFNCFKAPSELCLPLQGRKDKGSN
jgi:hypothetical protein